MVLTNAQTIHPYEANQQEICYVISDVAYERYSKGVAMDNTNIIGFGNLDVRAFGNQMRLSFPDITTYGKGTEQKIEEFERVESKEIEQRASFVREGILSEIRELGNLPNDWDGYGAVRVRPRSLVNAIDILSSRLIDCEMIDEVFAQPNGTVYIIWVNPDNRKLGLEIGEEKMSYYVDTAEETLFYEKIKISEQNIKVLSRNIGQL